VTPADLAAVRARLGLSLDEMAAALGIDRMTWWTWEQGRKEPRQPVILERALRDLEAEVQGQDRRPWAIQQEQGGEWVTLQVRIGEDAARDGAQALRSLMEMGLTPDAAIRIEPVDDDRGAPASRIYH